MSQIEPVSILLVDDRPENLLALEAILEPLGQHLVRAHSGDEALKKVLIHDFAVILLDVQMPGINGFETAKLIKARERSRYIPIIFLTAISKEDAYVFEGYSVGAVDYLFKPFQPDILRSKVAVFVDLYQKQRQLNEQERLLREGERRELELQHTAQLHASEARIAEIVNSAMDAIISFGEDQRITLFNRAAEQMFDCGGAEAIGTPIGNFFQGEFDEKFLTSVCASPAKSKRPGAPDAEAGRVESLVGKRRTGELFPIEASLSCLDLGGEKLYNMIARDVSERKRAEEALRAQAVSLRNASAQLKATNEELSVRQSELEKAMSARSRFYASMSHELRTPINAILGYNTLLLENIYGPLNEKQAEGLKRTQRAAKHLLELVNDVLDLSKIEAGKVEMNIQPVRFPTLIEDLFVTVTPMADERGSPLTLEWQGEPCTIMSDPRRVRQILLNLLSNAIKFGGQKPIRVVAKPTADGGVDIAVIDNGDGIAPEDLPKVFDEFVQLPKRAGQQEGTGLGLPISRRLAELLHGKLEAVSAIGEGSTFRLTLPESAEGRKNTFTLETAAQGGVAG